ncbi:hypothetical protein HY413_03300 [Candidatus Kaiserbacteria bacterium]|nr:hypothetical protein [Candidatus Kaiserbacteria bacterium]
MAEKSQWYCALEMIGAIEEDSPEHPVHVRLASGLCSDLYVNLWQLFAYPHMYEAACVHLLEKANLGKLNCNTWFMGPERGGIPLAFELGRQSHTCAGFVSKDEKATSGMRLKEFYPEKHQEIIPVEDVLTSGGSVVRMCHALAKAECRIRPMVLTLVNRSGRDHLYLPMAHTWTPIKVPIIALLELDKPGTFRSNCAKCQKNQPPIRR